MAQEDYRKALRLGQKEFRSSVLKGTYPYLQALDEILEHTAVEYTCLLYTSDAADEL